jgi:hypothetical protein
MVARLRFAVAVGAVVVSLPALAANTNPWIVVDYTAGTYPISPYIYGMAEYGLNPTFQQEAALGVVRWGGDGTTRYNWQVDSSNAGFDWYFVGGNGEANPTPSGGPDALVVADQAAGSQTLITIPIIPWINSTSQYTCSFRVSVYGQQQEEDPYPPIQNDNCGNSIALNGTQLLDTNIPYNHIPNQSSIQSGWVQHLVGRFGAGNAGGVMFYQLDNEPYGWGNTHRDVEPNGATYATIASLGQQYSAAVKQADPTALVLGPSDFTLGGWIGDPSAQNGLYAGQYYLQQMAAYQAATGKRVLDYFDEHYYFEFSNPAEQLLATRTLWDPQYNGHTWVERWFFHAPMMLIPRFRQWVDTYYPGTKLALSEYSIDSGQKSITDALAEADVLGIFGREKLDLASMWSPPAPTDPIAFSFLLYRNFDGRGSQYGATYVPTTSLNQTIVAAYGAAGTVNGAAVTTLVLINKTNAVQNCPVSFRGQTPNGSAAMYSYSGADLTQFHQLANVAFSNGKATVAVPAMSMNMLVVP